MQNNEKVIRIRCKTRQVNPFEKVAIALEEHFFIPCDLCNKYFCKNGNCPEEVEKCNSVEHWKMLLERIDNVEED